MTTTSARPQQPSTPRDRRAVRPIPARRIPQPRQPGHHALTVVVTPGHPTPRCTELRLHGELDITTTGVADELAQDLLRDRPQLIIDLSTITFLAAAGLHILTRAHDRARVAGGRLCVVTGSDRAVTRVLALTRLDRSLTVYPTLRDAESAVITP